MTIKCVNGRFEDNSAHDFTDTTAMLVVEEDAPGERSSLIFCRRCGEVRRLAEAPPDDGPGDGKQRVEVGGKAP